MSETTETLRRKIGSAGELQSVVRTMKALAASSIGQYEKSVRALTDYYRTVELGLGACFRESESAARIVERKAPTHAGTIGAIVFGSDQGLVGQFNDVVADYAIKTLAATARQSSDLGGRRARSCASGGCGPAAGRTFHRPELRSGHHPARRADSNRKRSTSGPKANMRRFGCSITDRCPARSTNR